MNNDHSTSGLSGGATPLAPTELLDLATFVARRPALERQVLEVKRARRLPLPDATGAAALVLLFENRTTLLWQVQEMCRVEGIERPEAIQHELDTYSELLPGPRSLSATLLIGYPDPEERDRRLRELVGLHEAVALVLDNAAIPARFDGEQFSTERISSVQFLRFPLSTEHLRALADLNTVAAMRVNHPVLALSVPLPGALRAALVDDLRAARSPPADGSAHSAASG